MLDISTSTDMSNRWIGLSILSSSQQLQIMYVHSITQPLNGVLFLGAIREVRSC